MRRYRGTQIQIQIQIQTQVEVESESEFKSKSERVRWARTMSKKVTDESYVSSSGSSEDTQANLVRFLKSRHFCRQAALLNNWILFKVTNFVTSLEISSLTPIRCFLLLSSRTLHPKMKIWEVNPT